jgi:hypothetical protein
MKLWVNRLGLGMMALLLVCLCLIGCGTQRGSAEDDAGRVEASDAKTSAAFASDLTEGEQALPVNNNPYAYASKFYQFSTSHSFAIEALSLIGNYVYYSRYYWEQAEDIADSVRIKRLFRIALDDLTEYTEPEALPITFPESIMVDSISVRKDGSIVILTRSEDTVGRTTECHLHKFAQNGTILFSVDVTEHILTEPESGVRLLMAVDQEENIYAARGNMVWVFDQEGQYRGEMEARDKVISCFSNDRSGKVYAIYGSNDSVIFAEPDVVTMKLVETTVQMKSKHYSFYFGPGIESDFLYNDGDGLMAFNLVGGEGERILSWEDCNIDTGISTIYSALEDGRMAVASYSYLGNQGEYIDLTILTKPTVSQIPQKELLVIGTDQGGSILSRLVLDFNRSSDKYRVEIKSYDAFSLVQDLNAGMGPDIIDFSFEAIDPEIVAMDGLLTDLTPYAQDSEELPLDDLVDAVVRACTYDDKLVCLPIGFYLQTVAGKTAMVGDRGGWTIEDISDLMNTNPEGELIYHAAKNSMLRFSLTCMADSFVDWENGKCHFDTQAFQDLLILCNRFPKHYTGSSIENSGNREEQTAARLADNEQLLFEGDIYRIEEYMISMAQFEEPAICVGSPTLDGTPGSLVERFGMTFGISEASHHKEGAWEFIEYALTPDTPRWIHFPIFKSELQEMVEEYMDSVNKNNTNPSEGGMQYASFQVGSTFLVPYHKPTEADMDQFLDLIDHASSTTKASEFILQITLAEAADYFDGSKTVEEVAQNIQNKIQQYVDENR